MINNDWPADSWNKSIDISEIRKIIKKEIKAELARAELANKQPVVDAIPIEWIKQWFNTKIDSTLLPRSYYEMVCNWMLYDWERENEHSE